MTCADDYEVVTCADDYEVVTCADDYKRRDTQHADRHEHEVVATHRTTQEQRE